MEILCSRWAPSAKELDCVLCRLYVSTQASDIPGTQFSFGHGSHAWKTSGATLPWMNNRDKPSPFSTDPRTKSSPDTFPRPSFSKRVTIGNSVCSLNSGKPNQQATPTIRTRSFSADRRPDGRTMAIGCYLRGQMRGQIHRCQAGRSALSGSAICTIRTQDRNLFGQDNRMVRNRPDSQSLCKGTALSLISRLLCTHPSLVRLRSADHAFGTEHADQQHSVKAEPMGGKKPILSSDRKSKRRQAAARHMWNCRETAFAGPAVSSDWV